MQNNQTCETQDTELAAGRVLRGRYVLEAVVGQGGQCVVYRAKDLHRVTAEDPQGGYIALKLLHPSQRANPNALQRLQREFRQMQMLAHANIARVFDLDCDGALWFVSMELIQGDSVAQRLRQPVAVEEAMRIIGACSLALDYAHSMGIVHGDLKPSNVLVAKDGSIKLIDFGSVPSRPALVPAGTEVAAGVTGVAEHVAVATPAFASPQVLAGLGSEVADDVFSLAALSYAILADGELPFGGRSSLDAQRARVCPAVVPGMPVGIFAALVRSLAGDRESRAPSAEQFHRELLGSSVARPVSRMLSRRAAGTSLAGIAVAVVCAATLMLPAAHKPVPAAAGTHGAIAPIAATLLPVPDAASTSTVADEGLALPRASGLVSFESSTIVAGSAQSMVAIPLRRTQSTRGHAAVQWEVESGSARPNIDYQPVSAQIVKFNDGEAARSLFIPLLRTSAAVDPRPPRSFSVALREVGGGARLGAVTRITVTIVPQPIVGDSSEQLARSQYPGN